MWDAQLPYVPLRKKKRCQLFYFILADFRDVKMKNVLELNSYVCVQITLMQRKFIVWMKCAIGYIQRIQ